MLYIPDDSIPMTDTRIPGARVFCYNKNGSPFALAYNPGAKKNHAFHIRFTTTIQRAQYVQNWFNNLAEHEAQKAARRNEGKTWHHGYSVGNILNGSWGYDQTNQEYYQVVGVSEKSNSIMIREISHSTKEDGFMCGQTTPDKNNFVKPARRVMVKPHYTGKGKGSVHCALTQGESGGSTLFLDEWDGKPDHASWYA